jgi:tetraacyldisaccharide 4'-kinase
MIQHFLFRILLSPVSLLYGIGVALRNSFYKYGILKEITFDIPTISVGNLSIGGAGKTPHIEYLIRLLRPYLNVATLSRGYNRKTDGYINVLQSHSVEEVGDEPLQYRRKFPDIMVTVSESRTFAIPQIIMEQPDIQTILLDDAFQHRSIKPGLNILLTDYQNLFTRDYLLPSGRLREWRSAYERADRIIISKCPQEVTEAQRQELLREVQPFPHQRVYFSYYKYLPAYYMFNARQGIRFSEDVNVLLICAIAGTEYLLDYLEPQVNHVQVLEYEDHHYFDKFDVSNLLASFEKMSTTKKIILTTEKDAMRLEVHREYLIEKKMPIFVLPVEVAFHFDEKETFDRDIKDYLLGFKV